MPPDEKDTKPALDPDAIQGVLDTDGADVEDDDKENAFAAGYEGDESVKVEDDPKELTEEEKAAEAAAADTKAAEAAEAAKPAPAADDPIAARVRTLEGKLGTVTDNLTRALADNAALKAGSAAAPSKEDLAEAAQSSEKFDELAKEFPEWADAMKEQINIVETSILGKVPTAEAIEKTIASATFAARQFAILDVKHDGWEETIQTAAFAGWLKGQDEETQTLADSDFARDSSKLLDKYEKFVEDAKPGQGENAEAEAAAAAEADQKAQDRRLDDAIAPTKPGSTNRREQVPDLDDAFDEGFYGEQRHQR